MSFEIPPQPVYIYDPDTKKTYYFDGVIKIEHSVQLKIEDDPKNIKDTKEYTNNAKNEPDEIKIEIVMSNVYSSGGDLPGTSGERLRNAFTVLDDLKKQCRLLQVVTSLKTYSDMLLKSLAVTQAEGNADSWDGEITLHQMLRPRKKQEPRTSSNVDDALDSGQSPSLFAQLISAMKVNTAKSNKGSSNNK